LFVVQAWRFYQGVGKSVLGKLIMGQTIGTVLSMLALGVTATFFMFDNVQKGVIVVLPIFGVWFISMVLIYFVSRRWNAEAIKISAVNKKLKQQITELKELDRLKDNFLNNTTHELKTPLIPIKSQVQLLLAEDYGSLNEEQKKSIEMIASNEGHLESLVDEVVDITKIRSGKLKLVLEEADLAEIITKVVQDMKQLAREKRIQLTLAPMPELGKLSLDKKRIIQVLSNLLNNALKFIPLRSSSYGGQAPQKGKVTVEVKREKDKVVVSVVDNGIGMSKETLKKLFTPFFQAQSDEARKYEGTGLGLAISKGFVEAHGGTIQAESAGEGKGSTISFSLPTSQPS